MTMTRQTRQAYIGGTREFDVGLPTGTRPGPSGASSRRSSSTRASTSSPSFACARRGWEAASNSTGRTRSSTGAANDKIIRADYFNSKARSPRSRRPLGVGDVAGERGDRASRATRRGTRRDIGRCRRAVRRQTSICGPGAVGRMPRPYRRPRGGPALVASSWLRRLDADACELDRATSSTRATELSLSAHRARRGPRRGVETWTLDGRLHAARAARSSAWSSSGTRPKPSKPWGCRSKTLTPTPEPAGYCAGDVAGERGDRAAPSTKRGTGGDLMTLLACGAPTRRSTGRGPERPLKGVYRGHRRDRGASGASSGRRSRRSSVETHGVHRDAATEVVVSYTAQRARAASGIEVDREEHARVHGSRAGKITRRRHVPGASRSPRSRGAVGARRSRRLLSLRDTARAMSQENVEIVRGRYRRVQPRGLGGRAQGRGSGLRVRLLAGGRPGAAASSNLIRYAASSDEFFGLWEAVRFGDRRVRRSRRPW